MCQIFRERHPVLGIMMTAAGISPSAGTIRCVKCSVSTISILTDTPGRPWHCLPHCTDENMETLRDQRQLAQGHTARILNTVLSDTRIFILCTIKYKTILNIKYCPTFDTEWQQWLFLQRQRKKILLAPWKGSRPRLAPFWVFLFWQLCHYRKLRLPDIVPLPLQNKLPREINFWVSWIKKRQ